MWRWASSVPRLGPVDARAGIALQVPEYADPSADEQDGFKARGFFPEDGQNLVCEARLDLPDRGVAFLPDGNLATPVQDGPCPHGDIQCRLRDPLRAQGTHDVPAEAVPDVENPEVARFETASVHLTIRVDDRDVRRLAADVDDADRRQLGAPLVSRDQPVGGGSRVFRNLPARFQNATIVPDPEFANARGFLKVLSLPEGS